MDSQQRNWLDTRAPRERRFEIEREFGRLARDIVPDCVVADETPGNRLPLDYHFGVEIYNVPEAKRSAVRQAVREYRLRLYWNERLFIHVLITPMSPPAKATIVVGSPAFAVAEERAEGYRA